MPPHYFRAVKKCGNPPNRDRKYEDVQESEKPGRKFRVVKTQALTRNVDQTGRQRDNHRGQQKTPRHYAAMRLAGENLRQPAPGPCEEHPRRKHHESDYGMKRHSRVWV